MFSLGAKNRNIQRKAEDPNLEQIKDPPPESCICSKNQSMRIMRNILRLQSVQSKGPARELAGALAVIAWIRARLGRRGVHHD